MRPGSMRSVRRAEPLYTARRFRSLRLIMKFLFDDSRRPCSQIALAIIGVTAVMWAIAAGVRSNNALEVLDLIVGIATVGLLLLTFLAANTTAKAGTRAAEASENASRAHVFVEVRFELVPEAGREDVPDALRDHIGPIVTVRNYGGTPAVDVSISVVFDRRASPSLVDAWGAAVMEERRNFWLSIGRRVLSAGPDSSEDLRPGADPRAPIGMGSRQYAVWVRLEYRTIFMKPTDEPSVSRLRHVALLDLDDDAIAATGMDDTTSRTVEELLPFVMGVNSAVQSYEADRDIPHR